VLVQAAFGLRRKQMRRVLRELWSIDAESAEQILRTVGVDPALRPETLSPTDFAALLRVRQRETLSYRAEKRSDSRQSKSEE
jgi:16S rRNA (adenine1518-N6/adenine1519-N6)-dimethyltransferase